MDKVKVPITRVGITMRVDVCREGEEKRDSIDQRLLLWVQSMGGIPLLVPNNIKSGSEANQWLKNLKILYQVKVIVGKSLVYPEK